jgi:phage FluMu gp28-like protein
MTRLSIERLRSDPIFFAENILRLKLHLGQKRILECSDRFICVRASRRFGKSFVFAAYAAWAACINSDYRVVCISRSQRQSSEMFKTIYKMIVRSPMQHSITRDTATRIEFSNGSIIESLPGGSHDSLRGLTIDLVLIDEAAFVSDDLFTVIYPTILTNKGKIMLISTPNFSTGEFYRACQESSEYAKFHLTHKDAIFEDGTPLVDPEELKREAIRCGGEESPKYQREILAEFTQAEGAFFDINAVEAALKLELPQLSFGLPDHKYVIGADLAQKNDYTVFIVLDITDKNHMVIVNTVRFNGKSTDEIMLLLYQEARAFHVQKVVIDEAGIGRSLVEHLKSNFPNVRWEGFNFNTVSKVALMSDLNVAMCNRILSIPDDDDIRDELVSFYYEENPKTKHISMCGNGVHDDYPIAIALAVRASGVFGVHGGLLIGSDKGLLSGKNASITSKCSFF